MVPPWVTASRFLSGNREAELEITTFSLLLLSVFSCLSSSSDPPSTWYSPTNQSIMTPSDIVPSSAACWGYSLMRIIILLNCNNIYRTRDKTAFGGGWRVYCWHLAVWVIDFAGVESARARNLKIWHSFRRWSKEEILTIEIFTSLMCKQLLTHFL